MIHVRGSSLGLKDYLRKIADPTNFVGIPVLTVILQRDAVETST
jgi:hypothetical protein